MLGIFYLTGFGIYLLCGIGFAIWHYRNRGRWKKVVASFAFLIFMSLPFTDYFIQFFLVQVRTIFAPPLQQINKVIDNPKSVYWEDNIWPGFDEYGRKWMVKNYLDGKHLQMLAMNGDDGTIYLYEYGMEGVQKFKHTNDLPVMDYVVTLDKSKLLFFEKPFIWSDRIEIYSTKHEQKIGYSKRYCGFGWWLGYHPLGDFCKGYIKGDVHLYEFDDKVLFSYADINSSYEIDRDYLRR